LLLLLKHEPLSLLLAGFVVAVISVKYTGGASICANNLA
jgi:hypothetical protein